MRIADGWMWADGRLGMMEDDMFNSIVQHGQVGFPPHVRPCILAYLHLGECPDLADLLKECAPPIAGALRAATQAQGS